MQTSKEIQNLDKQITPIVAAATRISIANKEDMVEATEVLSKINKYADQVKEKREEITNPLNEALKATKALFSPIEDKLKKGIESIRNAMSSYQTEQVRIQKEEEFKIANRIGEGKGKIKFETAVKKIESIEMAETSIKTDSGSLKFRSQARLRITDESKIPREYLMIDESKLLSALKGGVIIKGAEIEIIQVPVNIR